tara:strand:+ start:44294 stop:44416 length:123 start_codon:yes stop_codon:yes gene_type:complete
MSGPTHISELITGALKDFEGRKIKQEQEQERVKEQEEVYE